MGGLDSSRFKSQVNRWFLGISNLIQNEALGRMP